MTFTFMQPGPSKAYLIASDLPVECKEAGCRLHCNLSDALKTLLKLSFRRILRRLVLIS